MNTYYFSGSLTASMHDYLVAMPDFKPLDILISQLDKSAIRQMIKWKHEGFCRTLFIDSGAFSIHTGKAHVTVDEYIDYINSIDDDIDVFAQLDTIPGKLGQPKSPQDYAESAKKSWENYLYMRSRVKSPNKLMPVYHQGEDVSALKNMLEWTDESGKHLEYVGLSPANDITVNVRNIYLNNMNDVIKASSNPNVKTHLYGYTSLEGLSKIACYSADSISHRHIAAYNKILSKHFGVISITKRPRTSTTKSNLSFVALADEYNLKILNDEIAECGMTLELLQEDSSARVAFTMHTIQNLISDKYAFDDKKQKRSRKLFNL